MEVQQKIFLHVDMDAFFASIEQSDNPEYRGRPVVVGADPEGGTGRGVVSAASYEARKFGIHSAMPISEAYRRCPGGVFVYPRMRRYSEVSHAIMEILGTFSPLIEQISVDEAFMDCTGTERLFGPPRELGMRIKKAIKKKTGLTASVGIASNKSIAKIASDLEKPDGLTICPFGSEEEFLSPLPIEKLWGAGKKTVLYLNSIGLHKIGDIARSPCDDMEKRLGKWGIHLWMLARGIDDRNISTDYSQKSISEEHTFGKDTNDAAVIEQTLLSLADQVARRTRKHGARGRTVTLKIRLEGFDTYTRSRTLPFPVNDTFTIRDTAEELFRKFDCRGKRVRLVGVKISNLTGSGEQPQLDLFDAASCDPGLGRKEKIEEILDTLRERHGSHVRRASLLDQ